MGMWGFPTKEVNTVGEAWKCQPLKLLWNMDALDGIMGHFYGISRATNPAV